MKIKKVTTKWLESWNACEDGVEWFESQKETDPIKLLKKLIKLKEYSHANYSIVQLFNRKQRIQYAVFAAEQVVDIYTKQYPNDNRVKEAIMAAKKVINRNSEKNRAAAWDAARAAADAAWDAARAAADAARAAADSARAAADAAWAAADAAWAARAAADAAWDAAEDAMRKNILLYGIKLLEECK